MKSQSCEEWGRECLKHRKDKFKVSSKESA